MRTAAQTLALLLHKVAQHPVWPARRNSKRKHGPGPEVAVGSGSRGSGGRRGRRNGGLEGFASVAEFPARMAGRTRVCVHIWAVRTFPKYLLRNCALSGSFRAVGALR